jgi:hypothetical protein
MADPYITLREALASGRLSEFAAQEEARGVGPVDHAELDALTATLIKAPQSEDQTSRSLSGDGSTGKRTRQGSGPYAGR